MGEKKCIENSVKETAKREKNMKRVIGRLLQTMARFPLMPNVGRVALQKIRGVRFIDSGSVFLGENVYFDDISPSLITVGRNVRITAGVTILTHFLDTKFERTQSRPYRFYKGEVVIGDNVFIGLNTVIVKPVKIGSGSIIGANSVVTEDVAENTVVMGSPARLVSTLEPFSQ